MESGLFRPRSGIDPLDFSQGKRSNTSFFYRTGFVNKRSRYDHTAIKREISYCPASN